MSKPFETWTVLPHGKLQVLADGLWTVEGTIEMPLGKFERRMTIARAPGRGLVVFSPVSLDDDGMRTIDAAGEVAEIVVPSGRHRMDIKPWKARYPNARVVAPRGALEKVAELVPAEPIGAVQDRDVTVVEVPGTDAHEAAMVVTSGDGVTVVINELIFNVADKPGFAGWVMGVLGMTGEAPHMPGVIRMREVKDKAALAGQLRAWANIPNLKRLVVSHGAVITGEASAVLAKIAGELDG